ncbi:MAG TPA: hypothetical protein VLA78_09460 [Paracoccaceae bacterium]|nr:hypothetical protein [Paracoccaceae bacterium]
MRAFSGMAALVALWLFPAGAGAEVRACPDPMLHVDTRTDAEADMACTSALAAKALLQSCGLEQDRPILISVVERAAHPSFGTCLAIYDQNSGCLAVTEPGRIMPVLPEGDARAALPADVLFAASITHELTHAILQQAAGEVAATEQEFVAAAMEMQSLAPEWRQVLLDAYPVNPAGSMGLVHLSIYGLEPRAFANNAWVLFHRAEMGCSLVQRIADGAFRFPRR